MVKSHIGLRKKYVSVALIGKIRSLFLENWIQISIIHGLFKFNGLDRILRIFRINSNMVTDISTIWLLHSNALDDFWCMIFFWLLFHDYFTLLLCQWLHYYCSKNYHVYSDQIVEDALPIWCFIKSCLGCLALDFHLYFWTFVVFINRQIWPWYRWCLSAIRENNQPNH